MQKNKSKDAMKRLRAWAIGIAIWMTVSGCTSAFLNPAPVAGVPPNNGSAGWWNMRFEMHWPEHENPAWHVDLVLAHNIISPVLEKYASDIALWRFHRRAMRDETGHQFTFIFYASQETAREFSRLVASNPVLNALKDAGVVVKETNDTEHVNSKQLIEEASDARWSAPVQKSWPYFIMGVSKTWLALIDHFAQQSSEEKPPSTVREWLTFYEDIDDAVNRTWYEEGGHAFLHHLNALFEYKDVVVYEKRVMTF